MAWENKITALPALVRTWLGKLQEAPGRAKKKRGLKLFLEPAPRTCP